MVQGSLNAVADQNQKFVDYLLAGKSEAFKSKVLEYVQSAGLSTADPEFVVLLAMSILTGVLTEKPAQMREMFREWSDSVEQKLELSEVKVFEQQKTAVTAAIAQSAKDLVKEQVAHMEQQLEELERRQQQPLWKTIVPGAAAATAVLVVGYLAGLTVPSYLKGGYVEGRSLTAKDAAVLDWANSKDGQLARSLFEWNRDYLKVCEKDAQKLGVKLTFGQKKTISGFCVLWIRPPEQRKFES
jgi:DNA-binding transcriptional MerR regulator